MSGEKIRYQQLPPSTPVAPSKVEHTDADSALATVELVTVPALGPEWDRTEMKKMTKSGRREIKSDDRRAKWRAWNRGEIGLCGTKWFTKKFLVFFIFAWCGMSVSVSCPLLAWFSCCSCTISHRQRRHYTRHHHPSCSRSLVLQYFSVGCCHWELQFINTHGIFTLPSQLFLPRLCRDSARHD